MQAVLTGGSPAASAMPVRVMAALGGAVLLAHLLVLQYTPIVLGANESPRTRAFTTRSLRIDAAPVQPQTPATTPSIPSAPARASAVTPKKASPRAPINTPEIAAPSAATQAMPAAPVTVAPVTVAQAAPEPATAASAAAVPEPPPPPPAIQAAPAPQAQPTPASQTASAPPPLPKDAALVARAYSVPGSVRLKFNATGQNKKMNYSAMGEMLWLLRDDNTYDARLEVAAFLVGSRVLSSTGKMTADGLAPTRFSDKFRSEQAAHFERDKGRVTFSSNAPEAALLPGAQDQLSVFVQLASMIAGDPRQYPAGTSISIQTVGPRIAEPWVFKVDAEEKLHLPGGELATLKLVRTPRREYDQTVEIWLAPTLAYLPARIRITQANGDFVDQQWKSTEKP